MTTLLVASTLNQRAFPAHLREDEARYFAGHLVEKLLLHETVTVPTTTFEVTAILLRHFGMARTTNLLESGALRFTLVPKPAFRILNDSLGLSTLPNAWVDIDHAFVTKDRDGAETRISCDPALEKLLRAKTHSISSRDWQDIVSTRGPLFRELTQRAVAEGRLPLLAGYNVETKEDERYIGACIRVYAELLMFCQHLIWAELLQVTDLAVSSEVEAFLKTWTFRRAPEAQASALRDLMELEGMPDVIDAITHGADIDHLLSLRQSAKGRRFRRWLTEALSRNQPADIAKEYIEVIGRRESLKTKSMRFAVTSLAGLLGPTAGTVATIADAVMSSSRYSPRCFFDSVREAVPKRHSILGLSGE